MNREPELGMQLRGKAAELLQRLEPSERESLLVKCWMSHDARWFMAVAGEFGLETANRLNRVAAHETGKAEARRIARKLELPPVASLDDCLLAQELFISLLGPELLDYALEKEGADAYQVRVNRCFAYENALRAGIQRNFGCGIFARVTGWLEALNLVYEVMPGLDACLMCQGKRCVHRIALGKEALQSA